MAHDGFYQIPTKGGARTPPHGMYNSHNMNCVRLEHLLFGRNSMIRGYLIFLNVRARLHVAHGQSSKGSGWTNLHVLNPIEELQGKRQLVSQGSHGDDP